MKSTALVGILNITPDSFSDGGQFLDPSAAIQQASALFAEGATIVDIGAESTNPRKQEAPLSSAEELARLLPVLRELLPEHSGNISVDSYHPETIEALAEEFGSIFIANDVTGMNNSAMQEVVARHKLRCFVSHLPAKFGTDIQAAHQDGKLADAGVVRDELLTRQRQLLAAGLPAGNIVLDPGIGFGKTMQLNWELLKFAQLVPGVPVMIGYSRKRFLGVDPKTGEPLPGADRFSVGTNLQAARIAVDCGAEFLRVHDVAAHQKFLENSGS